MLVWALGSSLELYFVQCRSGRDFINCAQQWRPEFISISRKAAHAGGGEENIVELLGAEREIFV
jgi:hypothetical protein